MTSSDFEVRPNDSWFYEKNHTSEDFCYGMKVYVIFVKSEAFSKIEYPKIEAIYKA